ncbi:hypothetical protein ABZ345_10680 [Lentzea sp. NPDC005914]|uniref:hypothetical protein n=1 Tax=Lentzea sp. NPDC005914 TaxID=3154572 RepID=UPI0033FA4A60
MGVLFDYFAAPSDEVAASVIDGGPAAHGFTTVPAKGLDPAVVLGKLEELLTGRAFDEVVVDPRAGGGVAVEHGGELMVLTVTDELRDGLAAADGLGEVAVRWAGIEELGGSDAEVLEDVLGQLKELAATAVEKDERLYCWVCV